MNLSVETDSRDCLRAETVLDPQACWNEGQLPQLPSAAPTLHVGTVLDIAQNPKFKSEILGSAVAQGCGSRSQGLNGHTVDVKDVKEGLGAPAR